MRSLQEKGHPLDVLTGLVRPEISLADTEAKSLWYNHGQQARVGSTVDQGRPQTGLCHGHWYRQAGDVMHARGHVAFFPCT